MADTPLADLRAEARRVLEAARERDLAVRAVGGLAVALRCPSASQPPLARDYKDLDVVGLAAERQEIDVFFRGLGYTPDEEFNALQGHQRLLHYDTANGRQLDTFLDRFHMCHDLDLRGRLRLDELTLTPADLLLTKLQVVQTNERDLKDATALLLDADVDDARVAEVCASDWGWWRTVTEVLHKVHAFAQRDGIDTERVHARVARLRERIDTEPKGRRWRARAKVGDRVRWYELPEEND